MADKKLESHLKVDDPPAKKRKKKVSKKSTAAAQVGHDKINGPGEEFAPFRHMNSKTTGRMNRRMRTLEELISWVDDPESEISLGGEPEIVKQTAKAESRTVFDGDSADTPKVGFGQGESHTMAIPGKGLALEINQNDNLSLDRQVPRKADRVVKQRLTIHVPVKLIDRIKNAVYYTPGLTMSDFADSAFEKAISHLEESNGGPFQQRTQELKGGRPIK